jgi:hypothetical protein
MIKCKGREKKLYLILISILMTWINGNRIEMKMNKRLNKNSKSSFRSLKMNMIILSVINTN